MEIRDRSLADQASWWSEQMDALAADLYEADPLACTQVAACSVFLGQVEAKFRETEDQLRAIEASVDRMKALASKA